MVAGAVEGSVEGSVEGAVDGAVLVAGAVVVVGAVVVTTASTAWARAALIWAVVRREAHSRRERVLRGNRGGSFQEGEQIGLRCGYYSKGN